MQLQIPTEAAIRSIESQITQNEPSQPKILIEQRKTGITFRILHNIKLTSEVVSRLLSYFNIDNVKTSRISIFQESKIFNLTFEFN